MLLRRLFPLLALALAVGCSSDGKLPPTQREAARNQWQSARASVLHGLAKQQYEAGDFATCRKTLDDALALDPKNVSAHLLSAKLSIEQGKLEPAEKELEVCRSLDPKNADADYLSGVVYQRWERMQTALDYYTRACEKAPAELAHWLARAETLVALDQLPAALQMLQERIAYFENSPAIRDAVGQLLVQQGKYVEAAKVLRQASILATDDVSIRERLGLAQYYAKQYSEAAVTLGRVIRDERYATRADLLLALAECELQTDRAQEARDHLETASQLQAGMPAVWLALGKAALQLNDTQRAELALRKALTLEPRSGEAQVLLGYLRLRQEKFSEALAAFERASELDPGDPVSICMSGYVLEKLGRHNEAMKAYGRALRIRPNDELATSLMAQLQTHE